MNTKLLIALVVLAALGGAVVATLRSHESATTLEKPAASLPTIKKEDLTVIEIGKPDKTTIKLQKQNGQWTLTQPVQAKADQSAVDSIVDKLTTLEVSGIAATRKENHHKLQVDPETAIHVKASAGDKLLANLWIGASKTGGTMLRLEGEEQVLAVRGSLRYSFDKEVKQLRDRVITDVDSAELTGLAIESPKGKFRFDKAGEKWKQADGEKAIDKFSDTKVQSLASTLGRLRASDFATDSDTPEAMGLAAPQAKATLTKKDGSTVVLELGSETPSKTDYFVRASGNPVVYRVSKFTGDRMMPEAKAFQEDEKKPEPSAAADPHAAMGGPGGGQIPPELMQQIQQQLANQGH